MNKNETRIFTIDLIAESGAAADGLETNIVEVTLTSDGEFEPGMNIDLSTISGSAFFIPDNLPHITVTTNILGNASAELACTEEGTVTIRATLLGEIPAVTAEAISAFGTGGAKLQPPVLREAQNGNITTGELIGTAVHVDIAAWNGMTSGDVVVLDWAGTLPGGAPGPETGPLHIVTDDEASDGEDISFSVGIAEYLMPYAGGGTLMLSYAVNDAPSDSTIVTVDGSESSLDAPTVDEAVGSGLPTSGDIVTIRVPAWPGMLANDHLNYYWQGFYATGNSNTFSDGVSVPDVLVGQDITFTLYSEAAVVPFIGGHVELWYEIRPVGEGTIQASRHQTYGVGEIQVLPAPVIEEGIGNILDPEGLEEAVHVGVAYPGITSGDALQVYWKGTEVSGAVGEEYRPAIHVVTDLEAPSGLVRISIPVDAQVTPYEGGIVAVRYDLHRITGGSQAESSEEVIYSILPLVQSGSLRVVGARRDGYNWMNARSGLVALNESSREPVEAVWRYADEGEGVAGTRFMDFSPEKLLEVRYGGDIVLLRPINIAATGEQYADYSAGLVLLDDGSVVAWGNTEMGGTLPVEIAILRDNVSIAGTGYAFAALRSNSSVVAWGSAVSGGNGSSVGTLQDIVSVTATWSAFAALRSEGSVVAWGDATYGGTVPVEIATLRDIVSVTGSGHAFAAVRSDGSVVAWGYASKGGTVPGEIANLRDIVSVTGSGHAFTALRSDGSVVAWGEAGNGGMVPAEIANLRDIISVMGNELAFSALRRDGSVVSWGQAGNGGNSSSLAHLRDVVSVTGSSHAFAALRSDGSVVAWGEQGGSVPTEIATLRDIVSVTGGTGAFAALRKDGSVVAWGNEANGGNAASVSDVRNARAVYSKTYGFIMLTDLGEIRVWGLGPTVSQGNVPAGINGHISYQYPDSLKLTLRS